MATHCAWTRRRVRLEVTELLLLLGVLPPLTTSLLWRLVEAAVLVGHTLRTSQTGAGIPSLMR